MQVEVIAQADRFPAGVSDAEWLTAAGRARWLVLTKDKSIRRRENERLALVNAGVGAFVLVAGEMTGPEQADLFCRIIPKIRYYAAAYHRPFIVRVDKRGTCQVIHESKRQLSGRRQR
jgi:hypothetical protein